MFIRQSDMYLLYLYVFPSGNLNIHAIQLKMLLDKHSRCFETWSDTARQQKHGLDGGGWATIPACKINSRTPTRCRTTGSTSFLGEVQHRTQVRKMAAGRCESKLDSQTRILNTCLNMFSYYEHWLEKLCVVLKMLSPAHTNSIH